MKKKIKKRKVRVHRGRPKKPRRKVILPRGKVFTPEKFQQLIGKGKERGFVTLSEVLYFFPEAERDIKGLEKLYENLEKEGIEVKEARELISVEEPTKKLPTEVRIDPVQMYLKEIGKIHFITAQEEKDLAKKIEKGDVEAKKKLAGANLRLVVSIAK